MADYCISTLICAKQDRAVFQAMGYGLDSAEAFVVGGEPLSDGLVMIDDHAAGGHYDELTKLEGVPFVASNTACAGAFGDHLLASDGKEWAYVEALCDSQFPAVRVNREGGTSAADLADARSYWRVYDRTIRVLRQRAVSTAAGKEDQP